MRKIYQTTQDYIDHEKFARKDRIGYINSHYGRDVVAYDGEGIGEGRGHRYVLMLNNKGDVLRSIDGISTQQAFNFLFECKRKYPDALHVSYGFSYDVNMILRGVDHDVPFKHLKMLAKNKRVFWKNYEIQFVPRRYLTISRYEREYGDKRDKQPIESITIWDFLSFFQQSFVDALKGCFTKQELDVLRLDEIEMGKENRIYFTEVDLVSGYIESYSTRECVALEELVKRFRKDCTDSGIRLKRYDGAGAAAAALLQSHGLDKIIRPNGNMLPFLDYAGQVAYGGGRSELFKYGHTDKKVYHADIIGAFPSVMPEMVDLSDGEWLHYAGKDDFIYEEKYDFALYKIYWDFRYIMSNGNRHHKNPYDIMFPFFYRMPWQEPRIYYPPQGYTWVWSPELRAANKFRNYLGGEIHVLETYRFLPYGKNKPFAFINDMYARRLAYKKQGRNGQALALKLAMNAIPGKLAQGKGYSGKGDYDAKGVMGAGGLYRGKPPYHNILYAGYITSSVRAKVFEAAMQDPSSVIAIATDGIWSTRPLGLKQGEWMGEWDVEELDGFTSVQAGIYFSKKREGENIFHYRGFNQGSIREEDVIEEWSKKGYSLMVPTRRFVTMGTALASEKMYEEKWGTWEEMDRRLQIQPNQMLKRQVFLGRDGRPSEEAANNLISTTASHVMMFDENIKSWERFKSGSDRWGVSVETYLSRRHMLPWDEKEQKSDTQMWIEEQERISEEIIDSEI